MKKENLKSTILPYIGVPIIWLTFFFIYATKIDMFIFLWGLLIIFFGYVASVFDFKSKTIPNDLVLLMLGTWVLTILPKLFFDTEKGMILLKDSILGFVVGGGLFLFVYIISRKGLGGGDVKFMAVVGLYLGFAGVLSAMLYGTILAGLVGLMLILLKKMGRKDTMPLAPFLYVGILITVFYG